MKSKGFTLTEIISVIVIIGILILIAVPSYIGVSKNTKEKSLETKKRSLEIAAVKYADENYINNSIKITGTKLVLDNYYKAEGYVEENKELPWISNPMDKNDNLACHIININVDNFEYSASFEDESNCEISKNEIDESKIIVNKYDLDTRQFISGDWTRNNVLLQVVTDLDYDGIEFSLFGTTTSKNTGTKNCNQNGNINSCMNLYEVDANLFLNQEVIVTLKKNGQNDISKTVYVRIDKEKPVISEDITYNSEGGKRSSAVIVSDGLGSGIDKVYYSRQDIYDSTGVREEMTTKVINENKSLRGLIDKKIKNAIYYVWAIDKVGNESDRFTYRVKDVIDQVTVTYKGNGGSASKTEDVIDKGSTLTNIATASKTGYTFNGWYTASSGGTQVTSSTTINDDITLYAQWTINTYTLTYNNQDGSGCSSKTATYGSSWGTLCTPSRTGYRFNGWYTSTNGYGSQITSSTIAYNNQTAYAYWSIIKYTLYYDNQGGSGCYSKEVTAGSSWGTLCTPSKSGYSFGGWYTSTNGYGSQITSSNVPTSSQTVYAYWIYIPPTYTLTYDSQGGSYCSSKTGTSGYSWGTLCTPSKSGYDFNGWYTSTNGYGSQITSSSTVTGNQTVYAYWTVSAPTTYTLTLDKSDGSSIQYITQNANTTYTPYSLSDYEMEMGDMNGTTTYEYIFNGWTHSGGGSWNGSTFTFTGDGKLKANWTVREKVSTQSCTLTYDSQGGSYCSSTTTTSGSTWGTLCSPSKSGYSFGGWYTSTNGNGSRVYSSTTASSNLTVYAYWTQNAALCTYSHYSSNHVWLGTYGCDGSTGTLSTCMNRAKKVECNGGSGNYSKTYACTASTGTSYNGREICNTSGFTTSNSYKGGGMSTTESCKCQNVKVTYNSNSSKVPNANVTLSKTSDTINYGSVVYPMPTVSRIYCGYELDGWYTAATGGSTVSSYNTYTSNTTIYAHYIHKIQFNYTSIGWMYDSTDCGQTINCNFNSSTNVLTCTIKPPSGFYFSSIECGSGITSSGFRTGTSYTSSQTGTFKVASSCSGTQCDTDNYNCYVVSTQK